MIKNIILGLMLLLSTSAFAEDGHALWLRMPKNTRPAKVRLHGAKSSSPTLQIASQEIRDYWADQSISVTLSVEKPYTDDESYSIHHTRGSITVSSHSETGVLYGVYQLLRMQQTISSSMPAEYDYESSPAFDVRILNHWDNPDGTVERGYAGRSIWQWDELPAVVSPIYKEYARANASIGINGTVLNNVNAKPLMLSSETIAKVAAIANVLRPYGIKTYLAVNFASPRAIGGLSTADPLDADVQKWWKEKADEIYKIIPDFGGFLVKANSEGEPGPMDYGRTHSEGANMLADALAPHGGIVMWRAFVYSPSNSDRASQAYEEFVPLDGQFRSNVIIQIKNGPIDFQPREPFSPLFGGLHKTQMMAEFQITQEYLGESVHTAYLAPMWHECLDADLGMSSEHVTIGQATKTLVGRGGKTAIAGVANIGNTVCWTGSDMAQANWYAFGRLAWDDQLGSAEIAKEWLAQTFTSDSAFVRPMTDVLMASREAVVHYMMPLGLHHIFAGGHHYGPEPWCAPKGWREDWLPRYYHKADSTGLGFDRTHTGSNNVAQYHDRLRAIYDNIDTCPEQLVLWFHHVPWDHRMHDGSTMWQKLCYTYDLGVREAADFAEVWRAMRPYVDSERYERQLVRFERQAKDAVWWRDACLLYFQQFSRRPLPFGSPAPRYTLDYMMQYKLDIDNYTAAPMERLPQ